MKRVLLLLFFFSSISFFLSSQVEAKYTPDWNSLDSRPLPTWYQNAKFGIFIHWGVFSVPAFKSEWYWWNLDGAKDPETIAYHNRVWGPDFTYPEFGPLFRGSFFNATQWADIFARSGAKYVVLTSKHHDGFCNWPSPESWNWNSVDTGPHQDNVQLIADAVRSRNITFGLYHSLFEWFNPLYLADKKQGTNVYVKTMVQPMLNELVNKYKPEVIWSDGDWEMNDTYWQSTEFISWLFNDSPVKDTVVVNDRWGVGDMCKHGSFFTCSDRYDPGVLVPHKWENCLTIDKNSWGYNKVSHIDDYMTIEEILKELVTTVACNGNMLLNVGPTADGLILPIFEERLTQLGQWLSVNGEAIYGTNPWTAQNETATNVWYTSKGGVVYAIALNWPSGNQLHLNIPVTTPSTTVSMLGLSGNLPWSSSGNSGLTIKVPALTPDVLPCKWAWTFKLTNVKY